LPLAVGAKGPSDVIQKKPWTYSMMMSPTSSFKSKTSQFKKNRYCKTSCIFRGFKLLSSSIVWQVMMVQTYSNSQEKWCMRDLELNVVFLFQLKRQ